MAGSHVLCPVHDYTSQGVTRLREDHSPSCTLSFIWGRSSAQAQDVLGRTEMIPPKHTQTHAHPEKPAHSHTHMCTSHTIPHTHSSVYAHTRAPPRPGQAPNASVSRRLQLCSWWSLLHLYMSVCVCLCAHACVCMSAPRANVVHPMSARVKCQYA